MKKSGIVLMMTLLLITVMMGLAAIFMAQSERLSREGESGFSQSLSQMVVADLERQLPVLLSSVNNAEALDLAMRIPFQIETKTGDFRLIATLSSTYNRININRVIDGGGNLNESYLRLLTKVFTAHPIADPDIFFKLVFDTIDTDTLERGSETEISLVRPDFKNGPISDGRQFRTLLERYVELTKDRSVVSIPWEKYIGFEGEKMDFNAVTPEALSLVLPTASAEQIRSLTRYRTKAFASKEEAVAAEPALGAVFDTYFFIYKPDVNYDLLCDVRIQEQGRSRHLTFHYNLSDKKVQRVEFL